MTDWERDVREFHAKFGVDIGTRPVLRDVKFRLNLIDEEWQELLVSAARGNLVEVADALTDMIYVLVGAAVTWGVPLNEVWKEVHRTNMLKVDGGKREDGKILKPAGWLSPDVAKILRRYGWDG